MAKKKVVEVETAENTSPQYRPVPVRKDGESTESYSDRLSNYIVHMNESLRSLNRANPNEVVPGAIEAMIKLRDQAHEAKNALSS